MDLQGEIIPGQEPEPTPELLNRAAVNNNADVRNLKTAQMKNNWSLVAGHRLIAND